MILVAIGFELMMPRATKALTDATPASARQRPVAWQAWAFFVGVYLAYQLIRNLDMRFVWNPFAAANMEEMTNEAFAPRAVLLGRLARRHLRRRHRAPDLAGHVGLRHGLRRRSSCGSGRR